MDRALATAFDATWPAAEYRQIAGFRIGRSMGGGGRLGSAVALPDWQAQGIAQAAATHQAWQQPVLFRVDQDQHDLAEALKAQGYAAHTPTVIMQAPVHLLTDTPLPPITAINAWPPLAIQRELWRAGQIDTPRLEAMDRVTLPKQAILGRINDRAAGVAFVAVSDDVAMVHAVYVTPQARRQGLAEWLMRQAGFLAAGHEASRVALAVSLDNAPAISLYHKLGFAQLGRYDYWSPAA